MAGPTIRLTFAGDSSNLEQAIDRVGDSAEGMERSFSARSAGLVAAGAAAGAGLASAFASSLEFDSARGLMSAQLGLTAEESERIGGVAGSLYSNAYGESMGEVSAAITSVMQNVGGMSQATDAELEAVTGQMMSLAQVLEIDVGQATNAVGQMIRNGLAKDATEAMDLLTAGAQQGANRMDDLADVFAEYGETFQVSGLSGAQAMGVMTQAMDAGAWSADLVADGIREFGILAQDTASTAAPAFTALGLDAAQMAADVAAGGERSAGALDKTLDALRALPPGTERTGLAVALFGTKAEELGDSLLAIDPSAAAERLGEFGGTAAATDAQLGQTLQARIDGMSRSWTVWADEVAGSSGALSGLVAAAVGFGPDVIGMAGSIGMAGMALRGLGIASGIATAAQWLWNVALSANPIGLVVLALAGLVAGVVWAYHNVGWFKDGVDAAGRAIVFAFEWTVAAVGAAVGWFANLPGMVGGYFTSMVSWAIAKGGELLAWFRGLPGWIGSAVGNLGSLLVNAGRDLLYGMWNGIVAASGWLRDRVLGFFGSILPGWAKDILGIRSPSTVMRDEVGVHLPAGVAAGITKGMPGLLAQASAMGQAARMAASDGLGDSVALGEVDDATWSRLLSQGWRGRAGDSREALYRPAGGGAGGGLHLSGNTDSAVGTLIMHLMRTGQIQMSG